MIAEKVGPAADDDGATKLTRPTRPGKIVDANQFFNDTQWISEIDELVVPGILGFHEAAIVTGPTGAGKSTLVRQIGVQTASSLNPFDAEIPNDEFWGGEVLLIHAEGSAGELARELKPITAAAGDAWEPTHFHIQHRDGNMIDLRDDETFTELEDFTQETCPSLICVSPLYRVWDANLTDEDEARALCERLKQLCEPGSSALLIEAHTIKGDDTSKGRLARDAPHTPYGSGYFQRWADFGYYLEKTGELTPWRGPRIAGRPWPTKLRRGQDQPWILADDDPSKIETELEAFIRGHIQAGGKPGVNAIRQAVKEAGIRAQGIRIDEARSRVISTL